MSADAVAFFEDDEPSGPIPAEWARVEIPGDIPRGRAGRPKVRSLANPEVLVEYTRASSLGDVLEDMYAINLRQTRMVAYAVAHDPALRARAQAVPTFTEQADKRALKEIAETALTLCRASTGADRGTAVHQMSEQIDQGRPLTWLDDGLAEALGKYAELMAGFEVIASETFVVCDELEAAGSFDRVVTPRWPMTAPNGIVIGPGDRLVVDLKTGAEAKYFGPCYAVQQAVYAWGDPYTHESGRSFWPGESGHDDEQREHCRPRRDWSLILHVPIETPEDSALWWVDLEAGMELARLSALARKVRRRAGMFLPAEPPAPPASADPFAYAGLSRIVAPDYCTYCDHGGHTCPGCGEDVPHGRVACDACNAQDDGYVPPPKGTWLQEALDGYDADEAELARERAARAERTILGLIHATRSMADLVRIWERYAQDGWTPACTAAADAHLVTLRVSS